MSIAIPQEVAVGKTDPSTIYARITNKNIYRLNAKCAPAQVPTLIAQIKGAGKIHLKNWTKVEKPAPRTTPLSPKRPAMGPDPVAPRFRYLDAFKVKCNKLAADGEIMALSNLHDAKERKAQALGARLEAFQKTMLDTEYHWEELDRIQRVFDCVEQERHYAHALLEELTAE